jgi:hypothetical protein
VTRRKPSPACRECGQPVTFARVDTPERPLILPLDPVQDPAGTVAAYKSSAGGLVGRFLARDEEPYGFERRWSQHKCPRARAAPVPEPGPGPQPDLFTISQ